VKHVPNQNPLTDPTSLIAYRLSHKNTTQPQRRRDPVTKVFLILGIGFGLVIATIALALICLAL
jgi:hypothetical protein